MINKKGYVSVKFLLIVILFIALIFVSYSFSMLIKDLKQDNKLFKAILTADRESMELSVESQTADNYYNEAGFFYETNDFNLVESNCRLARDYFLKSSSGYKSIKAELISYNIDDKLIDIYISSLNSAIEIKNNMYEACEHFESAVRYYDINNYESGDMEIENMNEKIRNHDAAVEEYNQLLSDFLVELRSRL